MSCMSMAATCLWLWLCTRVTTVVHAVLCQLRVTVPCATTYGLYTHTHTSPIISFVMSSAFSSPFRASRCIRHIFHLVDRALKTFGKSVRRCVCGCRCAQDRYTRKHTKCKLAQDSHATHMSQEEQYMSSAGFKKQDANGCVRTAAVAPTLEAQDVPHASC